MKLNISTTIDKNYINDIALRLSYYKKLSDIKTEDEKNKILQELENRFGKIPEEIYNILGPEELKEFEKDMELFKNFQTNRG